jgi:transposase
MNQRVKRTQRDYTLAFKQAVVDEVERGELTYKQAQARYGIQGRSTVLKWLRRYGDQDWRPGTSHRASRSPTVPKSPPTPEQRIKELEEKLRLAEQKAEFFEAVVDVMEKDYGVTVKKRPGKSSRKDALPD